MEKNIINKVVKHYLESRDFNGIGVENFDSNSEYPVIKKLIRDGKIDLIWYANFHIKNFKARPVDAQIEKIENDGFSGCLYPTPELLKELKAGDGKKSPYTRELMKGVPQLSFRFFDLRMLEWYRNDPRFICEGDDMHYRVFNKIDTKTKKQKIIKDDFEFFRFGFGYNSKEDRAVTALIYDLHKLPYAQQVEMKKHELEGDYEPHPVFFDTTIRGNWPSAISIYSAFLMEKIEINKICEIIKKPPLFKTSHSIDGGNPDGFGILLRSTKKEFGDFAILLDKLLGDDINPDFFKGDIELDRRLTDEQGKQEIHRKGTIVLLKEWLEKNFINNNQEDFKKFFKILRDVRKARQKPAHIVEKNEFDKKYIVDQRELISKAYSVVYNIRSILQKHPHVGDYKSPKHLDESDILCK